MLEATRTIRELTSIIYLVYHCCFWSCIEFAEARHTHTHISTPIRWHLSYISRHMTHFVGSTVKPIVFVPLNILYSDIRYVCSMLNAHMLTSQCWSWYCPLSGSFVEIRIKLIHTQWSTRTAHTNTNTHRKNSAYEYTLKCPIFKNSHGLFNTCYAKGSLGLSFFRNSPILIMSVILQTIYLHRDI